MTLVPYSRETLRTNKKTKNVSDYLGLAFIAKMLSSLKERFKKGPAIWLPTRGARLLCLALCGVLLGSSVPQAEEISQEYQLKLAFLVNFARFIRWPEASFDKNNDRLNLCIVGDNPFGASLRGVENKPVGNRRLQVKVLNSQAEAGTCQLLYLSQSSAHRLPDFSASLDAKPIVTVSDTAGFISTGGTIELLIKDERLTFIINNTRLKDLGIVASSAMLNLAASVR